MPGGWTRSALIGALVATAPVAGGCAAAPLAIAPVLSAIQIVGDRAVDRSFAADREATWAAMLHTMWRLGLPVEHTDRQGERWTVRGGSERLSVNVELVGLSPKLTRVSLRTETGGLTPDRRTADEILNQVGLLLTASEALRPEPPRTFPAYDERITALTEELKRLRTNLEARETTTPHVAPAATPPAAPTGIVTVPVGAGVPTIGPPPGSSPASATLSDRMPFVPPIADKTPTQSVTAAPRASEHVSKFDVVAPTLSPVETLSPVRSIGGSGAGR